MNHSGRKLPLVDTDLGPYRDVVLGLLALQRASTRAINPNMIGFEGSGITLQQFKFILALTLDEGRCGSLKSIGAELGLTAPATSRLVDSLVERGLVERTEDPNDRRIRHVSLTAEGREFAGRLIKHRLETLVAFAESLDEEQLAALTEAFNTLESHDGFATALNFNRKAISK